MPSTVLSIDFAMIIELFFLYNRFSATFSSPNAFARSNNDVLLVALYGAYY